MQESQFHIRWMSTSDHPRVLEIDSQSRWTLPIMDIRAMRRGPQTHPLVLTENLTVRGFVFYDILSNRIRLDLIAVDFACRRRGYGKRLIDYLKEKVGHITCQNVRTLQTKVHERDFPAIRFFRSQDFIAVRTLRDHAGGDWYVMNWSPRVNELALTNRVSEMIQNDSESLKRP